MKVLLPVVLVMVFSFAAHAQKIERFYDWRWKPAEPNAARFYTVIENQDSVWRRQDYFVHEKHLQMEGFYKDSDCKVEHGLFRYYYPNGTIEMLGRFENGKRQGVWLSSYENGMLYDSATYEKGTVTGTRLRWYPDGLPMDSTRFNNDGSGLTIMWYDNGNASEAGLYAAGQKQIGLWKYFHKNGTQSALETYDNGTLKSRQYFDEAGAPINDTTSRTREATFPGGAAAWEKYLYKHLYFPEHYKLVNADAAVIIVEWVINEDGSVSNAHVVSSLHPAFDKIALNAINHSPKWEPAISHNRTVKAYRRQPVTFTQQ